MPKFGDLESVIMDHVWRADQPLLVREVVETLQRDRDVAYTTVQTVMEILYRKGWLERRKERRAYRYWAPRPREDYTAQLLGEAFDTTSDRAAAFSRLLQDFDPAEVAELREALDRARQADSDR